MFDSKCPNISSKLYNQKDLFKFILDECFYFLNTNSTSENNDKIAFQFAEDVTETRLDWKPTDITMFFKTIRQRQDIEDFKVFGNKITGIKLSEMIIAYEDIRAEQFETWNKLRWDKDSNKTAISNEGLKQLSEIKARLQTNQTKTYKVSEQDKLIQQWIIDFDKIRNGERFGLVDGKMITTEEYLTIKMNKP